MRTCIKEANIKTPTVQRLHFTKEPNPVDLGLFPESNSANHSQTSPKPAPNHPTPQPHPQNLAGSPAPLGARLMSLQELLQQAVAGPSRLRRGVCRKTWTPKIARRCEESHLGDPFELFLGAIDLQRVLGVPSISIIARDPDLFRKPSKTQGKRIRFLKRTMIEKNGIGINP